MISNYIFQGTFKLSMAILSCSALYILLLSFVMSGKNREIFAKKKYFIREFITICYVLSVLLVTGIIGSHFVYSGGSFLRKVGKTDVWKRFNSILSGRICVCAIL